MRLAQPAFVHLESPHVRISIWCARSIRSQSCDSFGFGLVEETLMEIGMFRLR
jgi:hypothetical protein